MGGGKAVTHHVTVRKPGLRSHEAKKVVACNGPLFLSIRMLAKNVKQVLAKRARERVLLVLLRYGGLPEYMTSGSVGVVNDK